MLSREKRSARCGLSRSALGAVYQHGYDEMGRPKTMVDAGTQTTIVAGATYGPAGELLTMGNETRQYNSRLQVTRITYPTQDWEYKYSATQNNGQITAMKDWTSGEEVNYAYDELKRLSSAVTVGPEWGNSYGYDGFGNLLQKNVVKGSAPYMNLSIDPATNKPYSGYSAAGLPTSGAGFDNDNRMISTTAGSSYQEYYAYSPAGKRVWNRGKRDIGGTWVDKEEVWFWGVTGQRMAFYSLTASGNPVFTLTSTNLYMGSKLVAQAAGSSVTAVKTDRLWSVGKFYPWGEERTPTGASGEKFATYYHDAQAALNYADQRWHGTNGRFQVPDPYQASARAIDPASWNRFSYVRGDPANRIDPRGLVDCRDNQEGGSPLECHIPTDPNPNNDMEEKTEDGGEGGAGDGNHSGRPGPLTAKNFQRGNSAIAAVLNKIADALSGDNTGCASWLKGEGYGGEDLIRAILGNESYGTALVLSADGKVSDVAAFVGNKNADGSPVGVPTEAAFTVNTSGAFFLGTVLVDGKEVTLTAGSKGYQGGTLGAQASILIHELAHLLGAAGFKSDAADSKIGKDNDKLVDKNCGKLIKGLK